MNVKKTTIVFGLFFFIVFSGVLNVFAMTTGFETKNVDSKRQESFLSNIQISVLDSDVKTKPVDCFDVSDIGFIALGFNDFGTHKTICVYNSDGKFEYGFTFESYGSFGVEWDKDNLLIYFVRSEIAALFNKNAECLELREISDTADNNRYWHNHVLVPTRIIGANEYKLKNNFGIFNFFTSAYSQLIKTDQNGKEIPLYDVSKSYGLRFFFSGILIVIFIAIIIIVVIKQINKSYRDYWTTRRGDDA